MVKAGSMRRNGGFTLIEAMIALAVVLVVAAVGAPSFKSFTVEGSVKQASSDMLGDMFVARSAAVKLNCDVAIAPMTGTDWTTGWKVSYSAVSATDLSCAVAPAAGVPMVLKSHAAIPSVLVSTTPSTLGAAGVVYGFDGRIGSTAQINFAPSSMGGTVHMRCVGVNPAGRPVIAVDRDYDQTNQC